MFFPYPLRRVYSHSSEGKRVKHTRLLLLPIPGFSSETSSLYRKVKLYYWWSSNVRDAFYFQECVTILHPSLAAIPSELAFCSFFSMRYKIVWICLYFCMNRAFVYSHLHHPMPMLSVSHSDCSGSLAAGLPVPSRWTSTAPPDKSHFSCYAWKSSVVL